MRINTEIIRGLSPCEERFNNYLEHYKDFDGTLEDFLSLDNITYSDKVWVFTKLADKTSLLKWSYLCAESVLYIFEDKYPNDKRFRQALDTLLKYINAPTEENLRLCEDAVYNAAYAVYNAAYNVADAYNAAYAAYKAVFNAVNADYAAYNAVYNAAYSKEAQQDLNLLFMIEAVS